MLVWALLGSQYLSASHVSAVIPPHFVVSAVQHADDVQEAASLEQVVVEAAVMLVYPAAQVYVEHIAFVVQIRHNRQTQSSVFSKPVELILSYVSHKFTQTGLPIRQELI